MSETTPSTTQTKIPTGTMVGSVAELLSTARAAISRNDHKTAEAILDQILTQRSGNAAAWHLRGVCARGAERMQEAALFFTRAVSCDTDNAHYCASLADCLERMKRDPDAIPAWVRAMDLAPHRGDYRRRLAALHVRLGRTRDALSLYRAAVDAHPHDADIRLDLGILLNRIGQPAAAIDVLQSAHALAPHHTGIMFRLGQAHQRQGAAQEAAHWYRRALDQGADGSDLHADFAVALRDLGDAPAAITHCEAALAQQPDLARALNNMGLALCDLGQHTDALLRLEQARRLEPDNLATWHNLGAVLHAAGRTAESEDCLRNLLAQHPGFADAHRSLGNLLREAGRLEEAVKHYRAVADTEPMDIKTYGNLGLILLNLNRPVEALAVYEKALALNPHDASIRTSLGITQLILGDFKSGWENYDARWQAKHFTDERRTFNAPVWRGEAVGPAGDGGPCRTILIHAEQGFGDTLQFCRYVPMVMALGGKVLFECQQPLAELMQSLAMEDTKGELAIAARGSPTPPYDFHVPLLSLPKILGTEISTIPSDVPYLKAPSAKVDYWADRLAGTGPAVGLVWSGNPARRDDGMRSCPADALAPILAVHGVRFYGLQKDGPAMDDPNIEDLAPDLGDFCDTAAIIAALDLVITVDTAVAHLAGALGRPVWVLLGHAADWRYLLDRDDSPWYPSMRLWRQKHYRDWSDPIRRIAERLPHLLGDLQECQTPATAARFQPVNRSGKFG